MPHEPAPGAPFYSGWKTPGAAAHPVLVWQDGEALHWEDWDRRASELAALLRRRGIGRMGLRTHRADSICIAIAACRMADCEILLARSSQPRPDSFWEQMQVPFVFDPEWNVERDVAVNPVESGGCHVLVESSGTTGIPKVARHSLARLMGRLRAKRKREEGVRWLLTYHPASFAGLQVLLTAMSFGDGVIAVSQPNVATLVEAALRHRPTHISATPTFWRGFLMSAGAAAGQIPLRQATLGGEIAEQTTLNLIRAAFPDAGLTHIYASTEAGALFAVKDGQAGFPASWLREGVEDVQLRIRDEALEVLSPRSMESYVNGPPAPLTEDGWVATGDLVDVRGDRVYFRGRANSLISVGGAKVLPEEVEGILLSVPGVSEARVYGIRNPITGSVVAADVVVQGDAAALKPEILKQARARLEPYKVPRILNFVTAIALSETGKKQRAANDE